MGSSSSKKTNTICAVGCTGGSIIVVIVGVTCFALCPIAGVAAISGGIAGTFNGA